jgi:DNA polymerase bacteriophage-type
MPILHRDYETRSTLNLKNVGAWRYATCAETEVWCCAYAIDDSPVQLWLPGDPVPAEFIEAARNPDWCVSAFNDSFERLIEQHIMGPRYGWPLVPIERHRCSQAAALALAPPAKLENVTLALGLEQQKDKAGHADMLRLAKPHKPRKNEDRQGVYWHDDPERRERLYSYCRQDVETERALHRRIGFLGAEEQAVWLLDATINDRGIPVDSDLIRAAISLDDTAQAKINAEVRALTEGDVETVGQVDCLATWLSAHGCPVDDIKKETLRRALTRKNISAEARRVMELRLDGAHAAANKFATMQGWRNPDGRIRGAFKYHGASTGPGAATAFRSKI